MHTYVKYSTGRLLQMPVHSINRAMPYAHIGSVSNSYSFTRKHPMFDLIVDGSWDANVQENNLSINDLGQSSISVAVTGWQTDISPHDNISIDG